MNVRRKFVSVAATVSLLSCMIGNLAVYAAPGEGEPPPPPPPPPPAPTPAPSTPPPAPTPTVATMPAPVMTPPVMNNGGAGAVPGITATDQTQMPYAAAQNDNSDWTDPGMADWNDYYLAYTAAYNARADANTYLWQQWCRACIESQNPNLPPPNYIPPIPEIQEFVGSYPPAYWLALAEQYEQMAIAFNSAAQYDGTEGNDITIVKNLIAEASSNVPVNGWQNTNTSGGDAFAPGSSTGNNNPNPNAAGYPNYTANNNSGPLNVGDGPSGNMNPNAGPVQGGVVASDGGSSSGGQSSSTGGSTANNGSGGSGSGSSGGMNDSPIGGGPSTLNPLFPDNSSANSGTNTANNNTGGNTGGSTGGGDSSGGGSNNSTSSGGSGSPGGFGSGHNSNYTTQNPKYGQTQGTGNSKLQGSVQASGSGGTTQTNSTHNNTPTIETHPIPNPITQAAGALQNGISGFGTIASQIGNVISNAITGNRQLPPVAVNNPILRTLTGNGVAVLRNFLGTGFNPQRLTVMPNNMPGFGYAVNLANSSNHVLQQVYSNLGNYNCFRFALAVAGLPDTGGGNTTNFGSSYLTSKGYTPATPLTIRPGAVIVVFGSDGQPLHAAVAVSVDPGHPNNTVITEKLSPTLGVYDQDWSSFLNTWTGSPGFTGTGQVQIFNPPGNGISSASPQI